MKRKRNDMDFELTERSEVNEKVNLQRSATTYASHQAPPRSGGKSVGGKIFFALYK